MSIRRNTLINIAGSIIPMAVMLVTVPLYLKELGEVRYGVLALVWMLLGYFGFLDMGLGKATANQIAQLQDTPDKQRSTIFWTALFVNGFFGLTGALILWIIGGFLLTEVLKIPPGFQGEAIETLPWMIATLPLSLISSVLIGALEGRNRFFTVNVLQIATTVVVQIIPLVMIYNFNASLTIVIPTAVVCRVIMNLPFFIACFFSVPLTLPPTFSLKTGQFLVSYGGWIALTSIISPILETVDKFLIGVFLGARAVTHYTLPYHLVTKARIIPASLSRSLFPKFSSIKPGDADQIAKLSLRFLILFMTPVTLMGIAIVRPFMNIWIGQDLASVVAPIGEILLIGVWANSLSYIPYSLLQGKGRPDLVAKLHLAEILPYLMLIWGAMHFFGVSGAASAWTVRVISDMVLLFHFSGLKKILFRAAGVPVLMIVFALVSANLSLNIEWPWRAGSVICLGIWCAFWFRKDYSQQIRSLLRRIDKGTVISVSARQG